MSIKVASRQTRLAVVALVAVGLLACGAGAATPAPPTPPGGAGNPYALLAILQQEPAATIQMPGAARLGGGPKERHMVLLRPQPASVSGLYGTGETPEAIFAYYDRELRALGYTDATIGFAPSQTELDVRGWCKPQTATLRLAIANQKFDYLPREYRDGRYRTLFTTDFAGLTQADGCPAP